MTTALLTLLWVLAGLLLAYTTYAAILGITGTFTGARYEQCPQCHHHYLTGRGQQRHQCPHGLEERVYQKGWMLVHHSHAGATADPHRGSQP